MPKIGIVPQRVRMHSPFRTRPQLVKKPMPHELEEPDFRPIVESPALTRFLPGTAIEIVRPAANRGFRYALFDFDGTLSLIRAGWQNVMIPMMVEILHDADPRESPPTLEALVREFVTELTGKQTIYQMIRLAEEVQKRGGRPLEPQRYKAEYTRRLMQRIGERREGLRSGRYRPDDWMVPGSREVLDLLRQRGVDLYLASGTDQPDVREEVALLGLDAYFGERIFGAVQDYRRFSKAKVIQDALREHGVSGAFLLGFGDGYVEIVNVKEVGGTAVAVASDEVFRDGRVDAWKRDRLIRAGADLVIPDYRQYRELIDYLWGA